MPKCTCGKCLGGFLSPRNAYLLKETATSSAELLRESMPDFPGGMPVHDPPVFLLDYVPPELRLEVDKRFAIGFGICMDSIAYCLKQGQIPKPRTITQCANIVAGPSQKESSQFYFSNRGYAEYPLDAVLGQCEEPSISIPDDQNLPVCSNDMNWEIVRQQLFCNSDFWPCGPYPLDDEGFDGDDGDGWVYYDTSNWKPPAEKQSS